MRRLSFAWWFSIVGLAVATSSLFAPAFVVAQGVPLQSFSVNRLSPAPGDHNYLATDGARTDGHLRSAAGLVLDVATRPLVLPICPNPADASCTGASDVAFVRTTVLFDLTYALTLKNRAQVGLVLPFGSANGDSFNAFSGTQPIQFPGGGSGTLGDPRLSAKVRILGDAGDGFRLAAVAYFSVPLAQAIAANQSPASFLGDGSPTVGGHVVAEYVKKRLRVAANLGGTYRAPQDFFTKTVGSDLTYRAAVAYDVVRRFSVLGEIDGAAGFRGGRLSNPVEGRILARALAGDFQIQAGFGAGFVPNGGAPNFRFVAGVTWVQSDHDDDHDGIVNAHDRCPNEAEDTDGIHDDDGCPETDDDRDGLLDTNDRCPQQAEDRDGYQDDDGCEDADDDGDGIPDGYDSCPRQPEDVDGDRDTDGCPDSDADRDGIADSQDRCPNEAEDTDGFGDEDGCPEADFDGDGIDDTADECPDRPETRNRYRDTDGCPDERPARGRRR